MTVKTEKSDFFFFLYFKCSEYCYENKPNFSEIIQVDLMGLYEAF